MIGFKIFIEATEQTYSWLSPQGEFHPLKGLTHDNWARKTLQTTINKMYQLGWMRIQYIGDTLYTNNNLQPPNYKQKQALIDLAIENHFKKIVHDNDNDEFTIWSGSDV